MPNLFELKKTVANSFRQSAVLAEKMGFHASAEAITEAEQDFLKKELMVVTVGEMRRGKSSMLNALLGEKDFIFPVDTSVCTNVVTIVRFGKEEKVEAILEEQKNGSTVPVVKALTRKEISGYVSEKGNPSNFKNVKVLNVEIPNPVLQEGVVLVDTPGVGSLNISHAETTYGFLPNADLLLFVSDAAAGLTETELNFLKKGYKYCKNILFPLTKKDLNPGYKEILLDNQQKISEALGIPKEEVTVIPISSSAKLRYLETQGKAMLASSNYTAFEDAIWSAVGEKRGEIMFLPFVARVKQELYKMADSVAAQYQLLSSDKGKLQSLAEELNREIEKYNGLKQGDVSWKKEISLFFSKMQNSNTAALSGIKLQVRDHLEKRVTELGVKICQPNQYQQVYNEINSMISEELLNMKETMVIDTVAMAEQMNRTLGLEVDSCREALDNVEFKPKDGIEVSFPKRKVSDKLMAGGRKVGMGMMGGSKVGMLAGAVVGVGLAVVAGPGILAAQLGTTAALAVISTAVGGGMAGTTAGTFIGGAKGCIDAAKTGHDVDVPIVQKAFYNHIESSMVLLGKIVNDGFITLRSEVVSSLETELARKGQELKDSIEQIKDNISSAKSDQEKLAELKERSEVWKKALAQLDQLEEAVGKLGSPKKEEANSQSGAGEPQFQAGQETPKEKEPEYSFL